MRRALWLKAWWLLGCTAVGSGCAVGERRADLTPPGNDLAWADAPLWFDEPALLVPPGYRRGDERSSLRRESARLADRERAFRTARQREGRPPTVPSASTPRGRSSWPAGSSGRAAFPAAPGSPVYDTPSPTTQPNGDASPEQP